MIYYLLQPSLHASLMFYVYNTKEKNEMLGNETDISYIQATSALLQIEKEVQMN